MTWNAFHNRGEILRQAIEIADQRRDGVLPMDVDGVDARFADEADLLGAMMLKWHTRLSGNVERALAEQPLDLEAAVALAWRDTSRQMPGVRAIMDRYATHPGQADLHAVLQRASEREWARLAIQAGLANSASPAAARAGRRIVERARTESAEALAVTATPEPTEQAATATASPSHEASSAQPSFVDRIRAVLAA